MIFTPVKSLKLENMNNEETILDPQYIMLSHKKLRLQV